MLNPLRIAPFLDKFKNVLFLNPFDYRSLLESKPQRITFQESELLKYYWTESYTEKIFCFWLETDNWSSGWCTKKQNGAKSQH